MPLELKYFVLKPGGDGPFAQASRLAMLEYAKAIRGHDRELAQGLQEWVAREQIKAIDLVRERVRQQAAE